jgi:3-phosphoshikimate 1-carboxyvinyltransferase
MALLSSLARGKSVLSNYAPGDDCHRTLEMLGALGILLEHHDETVSVMGRGYFGFEAPSSVLDAGNSGTTARMGCGLLAGQSFDSQLTGDASLRKRPMRRVIDPLERMGARIETQDPKGRLPLIIRGGRDLHGIGYEPPVPSAQVKSAILFAGLHADGETRVREPLQSRNHTELALLRFGAPVQLEQNTVSIHGGIALEPVQLRIPGDISSAAFFITAAAVIPGSELTVQDVGLNPTRIGFIRVLQAMGAQSSCEDLPGDQVPGTEPSGTVRVRGSELTGTVVPAHLVPTLIDEIPVLAVAAARAQGETIFRGIAELRYKESNRLDAVITGLRALGAEVETFPDGLGIRGRRLLAAAHLQSHGDHRMAMTWAIASLLCEGNCEIRGRDCVSVSYPGFWEDLERLSS